ncbi:MAG: NEW3 domain-containing protein [Thermoplasmata archaeon]
MSTRSNAFLLSAILALQIISMLFVIPAPVYAGTQESPELTDSVGDAPSQDRAIKAVWVGEETNETIQLVMQMVDWPIYSTDKNTIQYMVYFTVKDENYAVGVTFYLKGPLGLPSSIALFKVTYDPYDENNITEESQGAAGCTHSQSTGTDSILITVPKSEIGSPKRDDKMTHIWAAVYNYGTTFPPGSGPRTTEDKAGSYSHPGNEYIFTGSVVIIDFTLSCDVPVREVNTGQSAVFFINVTNNSTTPITMQISWSDVPKGWNVSSVPKGNLSVSMNQTRQFTVTITPPADVANNTEADIYIIGSVALEDGTNHTEKIKVRTRVVITSQGSNISPPSSLDLGKVIGPWGLPIIALIVIFVIIGVFLSARKKPLKVASAESKEEKTNE